MNEQELIKKIKTLKKIEPNKDWVNFCRQELEQEVIGEKSRGIFGWLREFQPIKVGAVAVILVLFGLGVAVFASLDALPGNLLYPLKIVAERAKLALVLEEGNKISAQADFTVNRVEELSKIAMKVASQSELETDIRATTSRQIVSVAENLKKEISAAQSNLQDLRVKDKDKAAEIALNIAPKIERNEEILAEISQKVEGEDKEKIEEVRIANQVYSAQIQDISSSEKLRVKISEEIEELEGKGSEEVEQLLKIAKQYLETDLIKAWEKVLEARKLIE